MYLKTIQDTIKSNGISIGKRQITRNFHLVSDNLHLAGLQLFLCFLQIVAHIVVHHARSQIHSAVRQIVHTHIQFYILVVQYLLRNSLLRMIQKIIDNLPEVVRLFFNFIKHGFQQGMDDRTDDIALDSFLKRLTRLNATEVSIIKL